MLLLLLLLLLPLDTFCRFSFYLATLNTAWCISFQKIIIKCIIGMPYEWIDIQAEKKLVAHEQQQQQEQRENVHIAL